MFVNIFIIMTIKIVVKEAQPVACSMYHMN